MKSPACRTLAIALLVAAGCHPTSSGSSGEAPGATPASGNEVPEAWVAEEASTVRALDASHGGRLDLTLPDGAFAHVAVSLPHDCPMSMKSRTGVVEIGRGLQRRLETSGGLTFTAQVRAARPGRTVIDWSCKAEQEHEALAGTVEVAVWSRGPDGGTTMDLGTVRGVFGRRAPDAASGVASRVTWTPVAGAKPGPAPLAKDPGWTVSPLANLPGVAHHLVASSGETWAALDDGTLLRVPPSGPPVRASLGKVEVRAIAPGGAGAYVMVANAAGDAWTLLKVPRATGDVTVLAGKLEESEPVVADADAVYWVGLHAGAVRLPVATMAPQVVFADAVGRSVLARQAGSLVVADLGRKDWPELVTLDAATGEPVRDTPLKPPWDDPIPGPPVPSKLRELVSLDPGRAAFVVDYPHRVGVLEVRSGKDDRAHEVPGISGIEQLAADGPTLYAASCQPLDARAAMLQMLDTMSGDAGVVAAKCSVGMIDAATDALHPLLEGVDVSLALTAPGTLVVASGTGLWKLSKK